MYVILDKSKFLYFVYRNYEKDFTTYHVNKNLLIVS